MKGLFLLVAALLAAPLNAALLAAAAPGPLDRIAAGESASAVLDGWCSAHGLPHLHAQRLLQQEAPGGGVRSALKAGDGTPIAYRRVLLACGRRNLSMADNWYLPSRLSPEMNSRLDTADSPFGLVVKPLGFQRRTLSSTPDRRGRLVVRAVLIDRSGAPFSYVVERYLPLPP